MQSKNKNTISRNASRTVANSETVFLVSRSRPVSIFVLHKRSHQEEVEGRKQSGHPRLLFVGLLLNVSYQSWLDLLVHMIAMNARGYDIPMSDMSTTHDGVSIVFLQSDSSETDHLVNAHVLLLRECFLSHLEFHTSSCCVIATMVTHMVHKVFMQSRALQK